jgi:histidinol-phosphate/aromatic aminotransferase/cobyric acid decarboxylase-like protein/adenosyl cobinamide kinase/adenosyl cobinamide phosphate guanylyltransferase
VSLSLVIGGTRSGKSAHAERLALATGLPVRYVATADDSDPAMAERIALHAGRRPTAWTTVQASEELASHVPAGGGECVLIDGLGTWIAGLMHRANAFENSGEALDRVAVAVRVQISALVDASAWTPVILVAEDAGHGVLPTDPASRRWLDLLGEATERLSGAAGTVELVVAGRSISLAPPAAPLAQLRHHGDQEVRPGDADHAVNVLAGGPPPWLREALSAALDEAVSRYPDETEAIAAIAALHGRDPSEIVPTNGAAEALWLLPAALRPRLAACVHPGFTETEAALHAHGVPAVRVQRDPEAGFRLDPAAVPEAADLVIVGNPASPSGTLDAASAVLGLRRPGRVLVVDEAFMNLVPGEPGSLVRRRLDDVVVVRSLTKALSVPGLRVGYAVAPALIARRLRSVRAPWSANALALVALSAAGRAPAALAAAAERAAAERQDLHRRLAALKDLRTWPSAANFCLVEVADGAAVLAALRTRGIAVRPAASFPGLGSGHLRITAREPEHNAHLVQALAEALS